MQRLNPYLRFAILSLIAMAIISAALWVLESLASVSTGSAGSAAVPLIAGIYAGKYAARNPDIAQRQQRMWRDSFVFTVLAFLVSYGVFAAIIVAADEWSGLLSLVSEAGATTMAIITAFVFLLSFLLIRFGYGLGIRAELKRQEKQNARV